MDFSFSTPQYAYTELSMSSGWSFSVNFIVRTSQTDANDFIFAGKAERLTDGITTKAFRIAKGYVMMGKTNNSNINCFNFTSGYSLSL